MAQRNAAVPTFTSEQPLSYLQSDLKDTGEPLLTHPDLLGHGETSWGKGKDSEL